MSESIENLTLIDKMLVATDSGFRGVDVDHIVNASSSPYDNDDMNFQFDLLFKDGNVRRLNAKFAPTYDAVTEAELVSLPPH